MGILSQILGSGDVVSKGLDLIDSFHTSETELIETKTASKQKLLESYAPFKLAQRYLALIFGFTFVGSYILVLVLYFLGKDISAVQEIIDTFQISTIMLVIIAFYFSGGVFESMKTAGK